jgi:hypothetical protein
MSANQQEEPRLNEEAHERESEPDEEYDEEYDNMPKLEERVLLAEERARWIEERRQWTEERGQMADRLEHMLIENTVLRTQRNRLYTQCKEP